MKNEPTFKKRPTSDKYQVRFWSTKTDYSAFVAQVEKRGLKIQDVFQDFMDWFTRNPVKITSPIQHQPPAYMKAVRDASMTSESYQRACENPPKLSGQEAAKND